MTGIGGYVVHILTREVWTLFYGATARTRFNPAGPTHLAPIELTFFLGNVKRCD